MASLRMSVEVPLVCLSWWWVAGAVWLGATLGAFVVALFVGGRAQWGA
jgi:hypothetical protein